MTGTIKKRRAGEVNVELICGHVIPVHYGSYKRAVQLHRCPFDGLQTVQRYWGHEYHVRCQHRDCKWGYWGGRDETGTYAKRDEHRRKNPSHLMTGVVFDRVTEDGRGTMLLRDEFLNNQGRRR